jgi:catechol 2,3-dioxygenase-like lactoylglutathione lyase family enzyme
MTLPVGQSPVKFHLSLNASDLGRSIAFYRVLFGLEPAKMHDDYAKFELDDPPVVFSLVPRTPGPGGPLGRVSLHVADEAAVQAYRARLESTGIRTSAAEDSAPGRADPRKLRFRDPDGLLWEIGHGVEDEAPATGPDGPTVAESKSSASDASWEHFVTDSALERIPHADASLDEVRLTGTFNGKLDESQRAFLVREARRVLRPGGRVLVHGLMADAPFRESSPTLPGLAALVTRVPVQTEPAEALRLAGFAGVQIVKFCEKPWFEHDGVGLREVKILARQPRAADPQVRHVTYRGPFREAVGDDGRIYERGRRIAVPLGVWEQIRESSISGQFETSN